jgi:predicted anti-sigma-YlaC factor YlaD
MMTCDQAREALLTADLDQLNANRPGSLAAHLETCAACRSAADRIAAITRALQAERALPPSRPPARAASEARVEAGRLRRSRRARWGVVPLLAAAGLAAILILRDGAPPGQPLPPRAMASPPLVESAPGRVAVLTTDNPAIVVVWQF